MRGKLPPVLRLVGVQPADLSIGVDMSGPVQEALPDVVDRAEQIVGGWRPTVEEDRSCA
jgi:hypothetical protein